MCVCGGGYGFGCSGFVLKFGGSVGLWVGGNSSLVVMDCGRVVLNLGLVVVNRIASMLFCYQEIAKEV